MILRIILNLVKVSLSNKIGAVKFMYVCLCRGVSDRMG